MIDEPDLLDVPTTEDEQFYVLLPFRSRVCVQTEPPMMKKLPVHGGSDDNVVSILE